MGMAWCRRSVPGTTGVRGLSNCGLSCCINALLQSFAATTEIQELLSRWQPSDRPNISDVPLQLKRALEAMKDKNQAKPHLDFLECLQRNNFSRSKQHDADEVFHGILNLVRKQMSDQEIAAEIEKLYKIEVEGCCRCEICENVHRVPAYFISFPLHLRENKDTLEDCFKMFFDTQRLDGGDAFYCTKCERKTACIQGDRLVSLPSILCVTLKRFRNENRFTRKLNSRVSFPETINMAEMLPEGHCQMCFHVGSISANVNRMRKTHAHTHPDCRVGCPHTFGHTLYVRYCGLLMSAGWTVQTVRRNRSLRDGQVRTLHGVHLFPGSPVVLCRRRSRDPSRLEGGPRNVRRKSDVQRDRVLADVQETELGLNTGDLCPVQKYWDIRFFLYICFCKLWMKFSPKETPNLFQHDGVLLHKASLIKIQSKNLENWTK